MNNITTAQIIETIYRFINQDIAALNSIKPHFLNDKLESDFIESLIQSKLKIKNILPERSEGNQESVSTPLLQTINTYADQNSVIKSGSERLANICYNTESSQRDFIKAHYALKGIPREIKDSLSKILEIYDDIQEQLKRSKSTDQLGTIQV